MLACEVRCKYFTLSKEILLNRFVSMRSTQHTSVSRVPSSRQSPTVQFISPGRRCRRSATVCRLTSPPFPYTGPGSAGWQRRQPQPPCPAASAEGRFVDLCMAFPFTLCPFKRSPFFWAAFQCPRCAPVVDERRRTVFKMEVSVARAPSTSRPGMTAPYIDADAYFFSQLHCAQICLSQTFCSKQSQSSWAGQSSI